MAANVFFIADTHFGHANVLRFCARPFSSVEEMDEKLIENWNAKVKGNDTVFVIGDMFYRCENAAQILRRLKGKKHLILGNHDRSWMDQVDLEDYFIGVDRILDLSDGERGYTLCHYPMLQWPHQKRTFMIHGHIHNDVSFDFWPLLRARERVMNAGVDVNGYEPVAFEELVANNAAFKAAHEGGANDPGVVGHRKDSWEV